MGELMQELHDQIEREVIEKHPTVTQKVCESCADCCSDQVPFTKREFKYYKKKYKNLMKGTVLVPHSEKHFYIQKKRRDSKCVFLKDNLCQIYEDRPLICQLYGVSPLSQCGLEGLTVCPDRSERNRLSKIGRAKSQKFTLAMIEKLSKETK
jgi:hypothetical protein